MAFRLTEAQFKVLGAARNTGIVHGNPRTVRSLEALCLVEAVRGWTEISASRYHRRARATERVWGTIGHKLNDAGRMAWNTESYRRKQH